VVKLVRSKRANVATPTAVVTFTGSDALVDELMGMLKKEDAKDSPSLTTAASPSATKLEFELGILTNIAEGVFDCELEVVVLETNGSSNIVVDACIDVRSVEVTLLVVVSVH
jgi:hypothetical protein